MKNYSEKEVNALIERFEKRKLPKLEWTHEAHLVVAIWYCNQYHLEEALDLVRNYIIKHNESVGTENSDTEGYHETITRFWLIMARQFLREIKESPLAEKCNALINSEMGKSSYPLTYYSKELLFSVKARHNWVEPDLKALIS